MSSPDLSSAFDASGADSAASKMNQDPASTNRRDAPNGRMVLGRYRIVRRLARGGMGQVSLARTEGAEGFMKPVVVKELLPHAADDQVMEKMFVREARILSHLRHPGIVSVVDFGEEDGNYVLVLEYVCGYHLGRWARFYTRRGESLDSALAVHVIAKVLDALHYAHTRKRPDGASLGITHRDISPSNIAIDSDGQVKVLDFGIARMSGDAGEYKTQDTSAIKGKLAYMPPELFRSGESSPASDLYACGVVLHEILGGKNEFRGRDEGETISRVLSKRLSRLSKVRIDVSPALDAVIERATHKDVGQRFADAAEMAHALRSSSDGNEKAAEEALQRAVARDFPQLPQVLDIESLDRLDDAWRTVPTAPIVEAPRSAAATHAEGLETDAARGSGTRWIVALVSLVAVATAGVVAWRVILPAEPRVVIVQQSPRDRTGIADSGDPAYPADRSAEAVEQGGDAVEAGGHRGVRDSMDSSSKANIGAPFEAHAAAVGACARAHAPVGQTRVTLRFELDQARLVERARLVPTALQETPLGRCLLRIARQTRFPDAPRGARFRIPLTLERGP